MKELLDHFGVNEFLSYLCPGVFLLASFPMWKKPNFAALFGDKLAESPGVVAPLLLILAYAAGLMVSAWGGYGANSYTKLAAARKHAPKPQSAFLQACRLIEWLYLWFFHYIPLPRFNPSIVRAQLLISNGMSEYAGLQGLTQLESPWDRLAMFRVIVSGRVSGIGIPILAEADAIHRRLLFALSTALVSQIVGLEGAVRIAAAHTTLVRHLPPMSTPLTYFLLVFGLAVSFALRIVAGRWWEQELFLTSSLCR